MFCRISHTSFKQQTNMHLTRGLLFVISAPTGGGKTTIVNNALKPLQEKYSIPIERMVTYTTRPMRFNEVDAKDYHFVSHDKFELLKSKNSFFEITSYNNNYYGSPRSCLDNLSTGQSYVAITDRAGIRSYKESSHKVIPIWITPPSIQILHERLIQRGTENQKNLQQRLELSQREFEEETINPICSYHLINNDLDVVTNELVTIIKDCIYHENQIT